MSSNKLSAFCIIVLMVAVFLYGASPASAGDPFTKLGRGGANLLTGWMEILNQINKVHEESGPTAGLTTGVVKGISKMLQRTIIGGYELITFPIPIPKDYQPIVYPEYLAFSPDYTKPEKRTGQKGY
jgi:putative exosortase-associated protein (TIGR04073 family)